MSSSLSELSSELPQVLEGELSGASLDGSSVHLSHQQEGSVVQGGNPDVLDDEDQAFLVPNLMHHIRSGTKKAYSSAWLWFCDFCRGQEVDPMTASVQSIVKFICHCYELGLTYFVMKNAVSAIIKYHITGDSGLTMGHHPLVC